MRFISLKKLGIVFIIVAVLPVIDYNNNNNNNYTFVQIAEAKKKWKKQAPAKTFALNFKEVEISEFVNMMSLLIGKNIILSDRARGKITIISPKRIPINQAFSVMKAILEAKGFAVIQSGSIYKIVPVREAIFENVEIIVDGKKISSSIHKGKDVITYLLKIKKGDATEIVNAIRTLKSPNANVVVYPNSNTIIFSGVDSEINGLIEIAKALDLQAEELKDDEPSSTGNIHVVHLENAVAEDLANVLSRIPFSETAKINTTPLHQQKPNIPPNKNIRQSKMSQRMTQRNYIPPQTPQAKLSIIANKDTNSLIIFATPAEFKQIKDVIKKLDIVREQVLIEALIVEVNVENGWGLGIDWMLGQKSGKNMFGGSSIMGSPDYSSIDKGIGGKKLIMPLAPGFQLGYLADLDLLSFALLNASGKDNKFKILSTPQILTIDNNEAELNVGEEIPVATNNRISESGTQFFTYEYKSVGIKLKITPHITKKKRITLDLYQEVNSVIGSTVDPQVPPRLGKRDIKTKVTVHDGKTIVVGGLIKNNKSSTITKVPILGDIPLLGYLFKRESVEYSKTNLLIFITPHIVTKQDKLDSITRQKREVQKRLLRSR